MEKIKIGMIGLGTVGSGVLKTLSEFEQIEVVKVAVKDLKKHRNIDNLDRSILTDNPYDVVKDPRIQIVVEVIGGIEPAFDLIKTAIENGKKRIAIYNEFYDIKTDLQNQEIIRSDNIETFASRSAK